MRAATRIRTVDRGLLSSERESGMKRRGQVARRAAMMAAVAIAAVGVPTAMAGASTTPPILYGSAALVQGFSAAFANPNVVPGANIAGCRPSVQHPYPVIIVEGTGAAIPEYGTLVSLLSDAGYCVYASNYGDNALSNLLGDRLNAFGDVASSAVQLSTEVDDVLAQTGASQVDLVGHSQGGMMPNYYIKFLGGAAKVHTFVALAPSNHGSDFTQLATEIGAVTPLLPSAIGGVLQFLAPGLQWLVQSDPPLLRLIAPAIGEQAIGSRFQRRLFASGDTVPRPALCRDRDQQRSRHHALHQDVPQGSERDEHPVTEPVSE